MGVKLAQETAQAQLEFYIKAYGPVVSRMPQLLMGQAQYGVDVQRDGGALGSACARLFSIYHDPIVLEALDAMDAAKVLDLGCGAGQFLLDACARNPKLLGVGLDISADAIALAQKAAMRLGLEDRLLFVEGDAFRPDEWPEPCRDADVLFGVGVLHEYFRDGDAAVIDILNRFAAQLRSGRLKGFVLGEPELVYDDAENDADLHLVHIFTLQGFPRRRELWLELFGRSALRCVRLWCRPGAGPRFAFYQLVPR
jgi:SAM-dependent methyltransferase